MKNKIRRFNTANRPNNTRHYDRLSTISILISILLLLFQATYVLPSHVAHYI